MTVAPAADKKAIAALREELRLSLVLDDAQTHPASLINEIEVTDSRTFEKFRFSGMMDPEDGWAWQRDVLDWWLENDRTLILKARQLGITWVAAAFALWQLLFRPGARVLVYSIGEKEAQTVARRIYTMYLSLPPALTRHVKKIKPDKSEIPTEEIIFQHKDGTLSSLRSMTSTKASGQGETASLVILDEFAYNENAVAIWKATQPAVSGGGKTQGKTIVISTANGVAGDYDGANFFYHLWDQAADRRIKTKFLPWSAHPDRGEEWYADNAQTLPPRERAESYPASAMEAFQGTGSSWFDADSLDFYAKHVRQPIYQAVFELDDKQTKGVLRKREDGLIKVFQEPEEEKEYAISVDPASGGGLDSSVVYVLDLHTQALCAEVRSSTIDPDVLAQQLHFLGMWYRKARIAVERTGGWGGVIITALRDGRDGRPPYPRIYRHRDALRSDVREEARYGFPTTTVTRKQIVSALEVAIRERSLPWLTSTLLSECRNFGEHISKSGRPMTPSPCVPVPVPTTTQLWLPVSPFTCTGCTARGRRSTAPSPAFTANAFPRVEGNFPSLGDPMSMMQPPDTIQIPSGGPQGSDTAEDTSENASADPVELLKDAIQSLTKFQKVEPDAVDKATAAKVLAQLHGLLAKEQTDSDAALTGSLNPRALRKAGVIGGQ